MTYSSDVIKQIVDKVNILDYIQKYVELRRDGREYVGLCPFHNESTPSFKVNPDKQIFCCFGCGAKNDIIDFAMLYNKMTFNQAVTHLIGYAGGIDIRKQAPTLEFLKRISRMKQQEVESLNREMLSNNVMNKYQKKDIKEWIDEGILPTVLEHYQVRYDEKSNRIVFPIHDINGNIINIKGRTLYKDYKQMGLSKYIYYYPLHNLDFLYAYYQHKEEVKKTGEVIIFEGSKSVLKLESWGIKNAMSLETSRINAHQINLLLALKCNIIFALDKGVESTSLNKEIDKLKRFTNVYWIADKEKILNNKDAPCDQGKENFLKLYEGRVKL